MKVEEKLIKKMLEDNEHNKHTTLYYLLAKKKERGDLELEKELEEYAEKEMKKEKDKLKVKERKHKAPAPLMDLTKPEMFDSRLGELKVDIEKEAIKRPASRSISTSVDNNYLNEILQTRTITHKGAPTINMSRDASYENAKKPLYSHTRKRSPSKTKSRRPSSREPKVKMYAVVTKTRWQLKCYS